MSQPASIAGLAPSPQAAPQANRLQALLALAWRYGVSTMGPVAVSGAHFIASIIFLRDLTADKFGLFSFVLIIGAFAMSIAGAGFVLPATRSVIAGEKRDTDACFKMSAGVSILFTIAIFVLLQFSGASLAEAWPLALFGALTGYRWFARALAYVESRMTAAILSDLAYSAVIVIGLSALELTGTATLAHGGQLLLLASLLSFLPFGKPFFRAQMQALHKGRLKAYLPIFRELTGWSLLGVALTEATLNAHAYLVTLIAGPGAFALPALGMLLMRPASLVQSSLPDLERPAMMRALQARDGKRLSKILRNFQFGLMAVLIGTVLLAVALLVLWPSLLLVRYQPHDVWIVLGLSAAIMAARSLRTPVAVLLQAAGEFKALARVSGWSALAAVTSTLALLLAFGASASLGGILIGDLVILACIWPLARKAKQAAHD
jgi:O-antigen/teichoic acid export membrane protein